MINSNKELFQSVWELEKLLLCMKKKEKRITKKQTFMSFTTSDQKLLIEET